MSSAAPAIVGSFREVGRSKGKRDHILAYLGIFALWSSELHLVIYPGRSLADFGSKDGWEL